MNTTISADKVAEFLQRRKSEANSGFVEKFFVFFQPFQALNSVSDITTAYQRLWKCLQDRCHIRHPTITDTSLNTYKGNASNRNYRTRGVNIRYDIQKAVDVDKSKIY